jgi:YVTN family beta-propeller protein
VNRVLAGYLRRLIACDAPSECRVAGYGRAAGLLSAAVVVFGVSVGQGQWLEKVIYLPDSLSGVVWPSCIAANSDARKIYVSGEYDDRTRNGLDAYVVVIDPHTNERVARIAVPENVSCLCYNPVVKKLYATHRWWGAPGRISVIDGFSDQVTATIVYDSGPGQLCCNTVNGKMYVSRELAGCLSIAVLDGEGDSVIRSIETGGGTMAFDSVGNKLYCLASEGGQSVVVVIDGIGDTVMTTVPTPLTPTGIAVNAARRRAYVSGTGEVVILDADADTVLAAIPGGSNIEQSLCLNELRNELYCPGLTGDTILAVDCSGDTVVRRFAIGVGYEPGSVLCMPEQDLLFCVAHADQTTLRVVDLATGYVVHSEVMSNWGMFLADRTESKFYCVNCSKNDVTVVAAIGDEFSSSRITVGSRLSAPCWASRFNKLYMGDGSNGNVYVLDCASGGVRSLGSRGPFVSDLYYDSLDNKVYCADAAESVHVIDCATDSVIAAVKTGYSPRQMVYVPRHNVVYCANESGSMTVIDCRSDVPVRTIPLIGVPGNPMYNPERDEVIVPCGNLEAVVDCSTNAWVDTLSCRAFCPVYCQSVKKTYMVGQLTNELAVLDAASDSLVATIPGVIGLRAYANETDRKVYAVFGVFGSLVAVVDAEADTLTSVITSIVNPLSATQDVLNDKMYITSGTEPGRVFIMDGPTDSIIDSIPTQGHVACHATWNPADGRVYITNTYSGSVSVFRDSMVPGVQDEAAVPRRHGSATIMRQLGLPASIGREEIYDISGRRVARFGPGSDGVGRLGVGVYFIAERDDRRTRKIVILR